MHRAGVAVGDLEQNAGSEGKGKGPLAARRSSAFVKPQGARNSALLGVEREVLLAGWQDFDLLLLLLRSRSILGTSVGMQAEYHCDWAIVGSMDTAKITIPYREISPLTRASGQCRPWAG